MSPGQRAEFILLPPGPGVKSAVVSTVNINTGLIGDSDPVRTVAAITTQRGDTGLPRLPASNLAVWAQRFGGLDTAKVTTRRKLYFDEQLLDPSNPSGPTNFYITVAGQPEQVYVPGIAPAITTKVGSVEEWTVENHALEAHVFHIHQVHYLMESVNGVPLSPADRQLRDDYYVPAWNPPVFNGIPAGATAAVYNAPYDPVTGTLFVNMTAAQQSAYLARYPYPSFTARFDFRDPITAGDFVFHCHILAHEDGGMMALMRVTP
jgi:FtsP/CotA-like multicopper oxidase with cupredoxin domain